MSLSKSKCWYSNNCVHFLNHAVPLYLYSCWNIVVQQAWPRLPLRANGQDGTGRLSAGHGFLDCSWTANEDGLHRSLTENAYSQSFLSIYFKRLSNIQLCLNEIYWELTILINIVMVFEWDLMRIIGINSVQPRLTRMNEIYQPI
jgi:hypothetical protein